MTRSMVACLLMSLLGGSAIASEGERTVYETEIDAGIQEVWAAFSTPEGLRAWMAPLVDIELTIGGAIRANYNADGTLGDETTITNTILAFDPGRMIALQATGFPTGFPFEEAARGTWSVFYFSDVSPTRTRITVVGLGYRDDEASQTMRSFFASANAHALSQLADALKTTTEDGVTVAD